MLPKILDFIGLELESRLHHVPLSHTLPAYELLLSWFQQAGLVYKLHGEKFQLIESLCLKEEESSPRKPFPVVLNFHCIHEEAPNRQGESTE